MKNVAVIFGGKSVEHDISIITALQTMKNISKNYKLYPIYIKPDGKFIIAENLTDAKTYLNFNKNVRKAKVVSFLLGTPTLMIMKNGKVKEYVNIDCAILCNHGHGGEDGSLQGLLELCEIPYSSCDVRSSVLCMDKVLTKIMLKNAKIASPTYVYFDICQYKARKINILKNIVDQIKFPCIVKPATLGSSIGINVCENEQELISSIDDAFVYDDKIIVEQFVSKAREFACAVFKIDDKLFTSKVQEMKKGKIYTFQEKYLCQKEREVREITKQLDERIKKYAMASYSALQCDGIVRVDFLYNEKQNKLYVNELNSIPGSLAFNLFSSSFIDLINSLISEAISRNEKKKQICYEFNSQAIENYISMTDHLKYKMS